MKNLTVLVLLAILVIGYILIYKNDLSTSSIDEKTSTLTQPSQTQENYTQFAAENEETHFLFDIAEHGSDEIKKLLERAELLSQQTAVSDKNVKIAMVIHGPDMDIFDKKNYAQNKEIVDLAARLDASSVIDFKICQTIANIRGISDGAFPSFMEMIPFAPDELDNLEQQGYVEF